MAETTSVVIVAGTAGAGKTRLLKRCLSRQAFAGALALTDPASAALLPPERVIAVEQDARAFAAGCACCRVSSGLARVLRGLLPKARRGEVAHVLIETRDPEPVLATLLTDSVVASAFHLDHIVAVLGADAGPPEPALVRLAALADCIVVIGGADANSEGQPHPIRNTACPEWVVRLNPFAAHAVGPPEGSSTVPGIRNFTIGLDMRVDPARLFAALEELVNVAGMYILRIHAGTRAGVVEGARHVLLPPRPAQAGPGRLSVVTQGLPPGLVHLRDKLNQFGEQHGGVQSGRPSWTGRHTPWSLVPRG